MLFEQGMARVGMRYKKRKNWGKLWCNFLTFDECRRESVYDTWDCLHYLQMDKTARRWFRKVLHPCFEKFLLPNGIISSEIAEEVESQERQQHTYRLPRMEEEVDRVIWWMYK